MGIRVLGLAANFVVLMVIARWMGQDVLGLVIAINGAAFFGGTLLSMGVPTVLLKTLTDHLVVNDRSKFYAEYLRGLKIVITIGFAGCIFTVVLAALQVCHILPEKIGSLGSAEIIALGVCSLCMAIQLVVTSAIRALRQPAWSGFFQFCSPPLFLFAAFAAARALYPDVSLSVGLNAQTVSFVGNTILMLVFFRRAAHNETLSCTLDDFSWIDARGFWILSFLSSAAANAPVLLATILFDPSTIALIGVPFRIANLPMTIVTALGAYYSPLIREAHLLENWDRMRSELVQSQWIGSILVFPFLVTAIVAPTWLLGLFHIHSATAEIVLLVFTCAQLIIASCGVCSQYLAMTNLQDKASRLTLISLVSISVLAILLGKYWGACGVAVIWASFSSIRQLALRQICPTRAPASAVSTMQ